MWKLEVGKTFKNLFAFKPFIATKDKAKNGKKRDKVAPYTH